MFGVLLSWKPSMGRRRWFHDTLVDGDLAINSMMWQVSACHLPTSPAHLKRAPVWPHSTH